jgi:hypothetical protein
MTYVPCSERTFLLKLAPAFVSSYSGQAFYLRHLVERLGRGPAQRVWSHLYQAEEDELLADILDDGWAAVEGEHRDPAAEVADYVQDLFSPLLEGMTPAQVQTLLGGGLPFRAINDRFDDLNVERQTRTYEALHLFLHPLAILTEALIDLHGKQGELIAYDALRYRLAANPPEPLSAQEALAQYMEEPEEPTILAAGHDFQVVRANDREVVVNVTECEWARYFREHHPRVGYLIACSMDEEYARAEHPRLRQQRTRTLMEGDVLCDFRHYLLPGDDDD